MSTSNDSEEVRTIKGARRIAVWVIVVSLVITAAIGIFSLVTGSLDETRAKIMLTTLSVAAFSILSLCHLAVLGRAIKIVGWMGIGTSIIAFASSATLIWWNWDDLAFQPNDFYMTVTKTFAVSGIVAVSFAHANLMLLLANAPWNWVRTSLMVTLVLIAVVPTLVIPPILTDGEFPPVSFQETYWRFFGVVLILDALGTIALPVTTLILRSQKRHDREVSPPAVTASPGTFTVSLTPTDAKWVLAQAKESRSTPETIITSAVTAARKR